MFEDGQEDSSGSEAPEASTVAAEAVTDVGEPAAASAGSNGVDAWKPPSREEYEELRRFADVGREFHPHADAIRQRLQSAFQPQQAHAQAPQKQGAADEEDDFADPEKYAKWWDAVGRDPRAFRKVLHRESKTASKEWADKVAKLEEKISQIEPALMDMRGFALLANHRFQTNPEFSKREKRVLELVNSGKVTDIGLAYEIAKNEERAKAGAAAPVAKPVPKPAPRDDRSLQDTRAPKGRGRSTDEPVATGGKHKNRIRAALESAAREVGA